MKYCMKCNEIMKPKTAVVVIVHFYFTGDALQKNL